MSSQYHDPANITNPEHAEHRIVQPGTYIAIYIALLFLTGLTVAAAFVDLHIFNPVIAVAIACIKGMLVILFFIMTLVKGPAVLVRPI